MRTFMNWAVVLLVPAIFGATARPQEPGIPRGATVKLLLLRQKSVQKELKLDADVVTKIMEFTAKQSNAAKKALALGEAERKKAFEKLAKENEKFLTDSLTEAQGKRLEQLKMRFTMLRQLVKAKIIKELELSDEQVQKLKDLRATARKALVELIQSKEREGKSEKLAKLHEGIRAKILAILTDDQKKKVREKMGAPFKGKIEFEEED
jgi:hypothetical protein